MYSPGLFAHQSLHRGFGTHSKNSRSGMDDHNSDTMFWPWHVRDSSLPSSQSRTGYNSWMCIPICSCVEGTITAIFNHCLASYWLPCFHPIRVTGCWTANNSTFLRDANWYHPIFCVCRSLPPKLQIVHLGALLDLRLPQLLWFLPFLTFYTPTLPKMGPPVTSGVA